MASPSNRRREGRNAFFPGGNPEHECPYTKPFSGREDWIEGWRQEEEEQEEHDMQQEQEETDWAFLSCCCPWNEDSKCRATSAPCEKHSCAVEYFKREDTRI